MTSHALGGLEGSRLTLLLHAASERWVDVMAATYLEKKWHHIN